MDGRNKYGEGSWFAIPLQNGAYAVGIVARRAKQGSGSIIVGHFFGPARESIPPLSSVEGLTANRSILVGRFGHLSLKDGSWPIIGRSENWDRQDWPVPQFREESAFGQVNRVAYDDANPGRTTSRRPATQDEVDDLPEATLFAPGSIEKRLAELLSQK